MHYTCSQGDPVMATPSHTPTRPAQGWVEEMSAHIKALDPNHLVMLGHAGSFGASVPALCVPPAACVLRLPELVQALPSDASLHQYGRFTEIQLRKYGAARRSKYESIAKFIQPLQWIITSPGCT